MRLAPITPPLKPLTREIRASLARKVGWGAALASLPGLTWAGPLGEQIVHGNVAIARPDPANTQVTQSSPSAIVNWQSFSVGGHEYVQFIQPGTNAVILNRVVGGNVSQIFGQIDANGRVFLINPQGVHFGPGAHVDVAGLVASAQDIEDDDFIHGKYVFSKSPNGAATGTVTNEGTINVDQFAVLMGDRVDNAGFINARLGQVALVAGNATTLQLDADGLVNFEVNEESVAALAGVTNSGQIIADGGQVQMTAKVADGLVATAVNNEGLIRARSISESKGEIILGASGGDIVNGGTIDASGLGGQRGGTIRITGDQDVVLAANSLVKARGSDHGKGGTVRLIAEKILNVRDDATVDVRGGRHGTGGFLELSGHGAMRVRGETEVGKGGTLLIDPDTFKIVKGSIGPSYGYGSASGSAGSNDVLIGDQFIESKLNAGINVRLDAINRIFAGTSDGTPAPTSIMATTGSADLTFRITGGEGDIDLEGFDITVRGEFFAAAGSGGGDVLLGDVTSLDPNGGSDGFLEIVANNGTARFGALDAISTGPNGRAEIDIFARNVVRAEGRVRARGRTSANVNIQANRAVLKNGAIAEAIAPDATAQVRISTRQGLDIGGDVLAEAKSSARVFIDNDTSGDMIFRDKVQAIGPPDQSLVSVKYGGNEPGSIRTVGDGMFLARRIITGGEGFGGTGDLNVDVKTHSPEIFIQRRGGSTTNVSVDNSSFTARTMVNFFSQQVSERTVAGRNGFNAIRLKMGGNTEVFGDIVAGTIGVDVANGGLYFGNDVFVGSSAFADEFGDAVSIAALRAARRPDGSAPGTPKNNDGVDILGPNAIFRGQHYIEFAGSLTLDDPDTPYVVFMTDGDMHLGSGVFNANSAGNDFLAQFTTYTPTRDIHIEAVRPAVVPIFPEDPDPGYAIFFKDANFDKLPGTTLLIGQGSLPGGPHLGIIDIGQDGIIDIGDQNILVVSGGGINGLDQVRSTGFVGELDLFAASDDVFEIPIVDEFNEDDDENAVIELDEGEGEDDKLVDSSDSNDETKGKVCQ